MKMTYEERGLTLLRQAIAMLWELSDAWSAILCLERLAVAVTRGDPRRAARLLAATTAWREKVGLPRPSAEDERHERAVAAVRATLSEADFTAAWEVGQTLSPESAIAEALDELPSVR